MIINSVMLYEMITFGYTSREGEQKTRKNKERERNEEGGYLNVNCNIFLALAFWTLPPSYYVMSTNFHFQRERELNLYF